MSSIREIQKKLANGDPFRMEGETGEFFLRPVSAAPVQHYEMLRDRSYERTGIMVLICDRNITMVKGTFDNEVCVRDKFFVEIKFV